MLSIHFYIVLLLSPSKITVKTSVSIYDLQRKLMLTIKYNMSDK